MMMLSYFLTRIFCRLTRHDMPQDFNDSIEYHGALYAAWVCKRCGYTAIHRAGA